MRNEHVKTRAQQQQQSMPGTITSSRERGKARHGREKERGGGEEEEQRETLHSRLTDEAEAAEAGSGEHNGFIFCNLMPVHRGVVVEGGGGGGTEGSEELKGEEQGLPGRGCWWGIIGVNRKLSVKIIIKVCVCVCPVSLCLSLSLSLFLSLSHSFSFTLSLVPSLHPLNSTFNLPVLTFPFRRVCY